MILEFVIDVFCGFLVQLMSAANAVSIPVNGIQTLATFASYGSYIVGSDLLLTFCGVVFMWMGTKLTVGVGLFVWRLLPLT